MWWNAFSDTITSNFSPFSWSSPHFSSFTPPARSRKTHADLNTPPKLRCFTYWELQNATTTRSSNEAIIFSEESTPRHSLKPIASWSINENEPTPHPKSYSSNSTPFHTITRSSGRTHPLLLMKEATCLEHRSWMSCVSTNWEAALSNKEGFEEDIQYKKQ